jgi:thiol-disulfide isomerase/thioredoxin
VFTDSKGANVRIVLRQAIILAALFLAGRATAAGLPLRYNLTVGSRLHYGSTSESWYARSARGQVRLTEVWVVGQNPDQGWRLVMRRTSTPYRIDSVGRRTDGEPQAEWARCDLAADGRATGVNSTGALDPSLVFVPLPADSTEQAWERFDVENSERTRYRFEPGPSDSIRLIRADYETPLDSIYLTSSHAVFQFDTKRSLVARKESETEQIWGPSAGKSGSVMTLDSVTRFDTIVARKFDRELAVFLEADSAYAALLDRAGEDPARKQALLDSAQAVMDSGRARVSDSTVQTMFDDEVGTLEEIALQMDEDAAWRDSLAGRPAPAWSLTGLDGKNHSLKDYRGKVVILDFWYRGCPWCIRAMPQLNELAQQYQGKPVAVIGMNIDKDTADARFVVEKLRLSYTNVLARGEDKSYRVQGFPTLYVIDAKGVIRDIHVGYSPGLGAKLAVTVERLLARK